MPTATKNDNKKFSSFINPAAPIFPISIISEMIGVHQRTLRIYDEEGLLVPKRTEKNRRLYSMDDVERGKFIQYLTRDLGINLAGVRIIFNLLFQLKVAPENYVSHLQKVARSLNITPEEQAQKRQKLMKRGRKPKNA
ncbi:MAG: MerR family transcriptional regulator [bacterium]|nr:MerR family transcriptional regulator [bacterium]